jgi:hypothetical protein
VIARGSARETRGRDQRVGSWLTSELADRRTALGEEIIRLPTATINLLDPR